MGIRVYTLIFQLVNKPYPIIKQNLVLYVIIVYSPKRKETFYVENEPGFNGVLYYFRIEIVLFLCLVITMYLIQSLKLIPTC